MYVQGKTQKNLTRSVRQKASYIAKSLRHTSLEADLTDNIHWTRFYLCAWPWIFPEQIVCIIVCMLRETVSPRFDTALALCRESYCCQDMLTQRSSKSGATDFTVSLTMEKWATYCMQNLDQSFQHNQLCSTIQTVKNKRRFRKCRSIEKIRQITGMPNLTSSYK